MKRTVVISLVALLVVALALTFVACSNGGVNTEKEWNDAMDYLRNSEAVTITIENNDYTNLHISETIGVTTIIYDGANGVLQVDRVIKVFNVRVLTQTKYEKSYYVVDGAEIKYYTKEFVDSDYQNWQATSTTFDSHEEALLQLKEEFLNCLNKYGIDTLSFNQFTLNGNKFERKESVSQFDTVQRVKFTKGKLSEITFESKPKSGSGGIDYKKYVTTVQYSATVTTPNGLSEAIWK